MGPKAEGRVRMLKSHKQSSQEVKWRASSQAGTAQQAEG